MSNVTRALIRRASSMTQCYGAVTTGNRNGKPYGEIVIRPLDGHDCDRSGYVPLNKLSAYVFPNRRRIYMHTRDDDPYAEVFRDLKQMNKKYFTFITTLRTQVDENLYREKWRSECGSTNLLLRVQLLHVGNSSYSIQNELMHEDDPDHKLAVLTHHVTLIDPATRRPVKLPQEFTEKNKKYALAESLPYRVTLTEPADVNSIHGYWTTIRWSDTDIYKHLNTTVYLKFAIDAVYDAVQQGKFQEYTDSEGVFKIKDFVMRFAKESLQGQKMDMELWEGPVVSSSVQHSHGCEDSCHLLRWVRVPTQI